MPYLNNLGVFLKSCNVYFNVNPSVFKSPVRFIDMAFGIQKNLDPIKTDDLGHNSPNNLKPRDFLNFIINL